MEHETNETAAENGPTWHNVALGACGLVLTVGGLAIGVWTESLDKRLEDLRVNINDLRHIVDNRADLPPRVAELEAGHKMIKDQVRALERQADRNGWK